MLKILIFFFPTKLPIYLFLGATINSHRLHTPSEPLSHFIVPVFHKAGWGDHDGLINLRPEIRTLLEESPHERDALQCLPQSHLVSHDAAVGVGDAPPRHTLPQKFHTLIKVQHTDKLS